MKYIKDYISEALKINSKSKVNDSGILHPNDFRDMETPGFTWDDEDIFLIGKPFKDKNSKEYIETMNYIKEKKYKIGNTFDDMDKDDFEYFAYARFENDDEVNCFVYPDAAYALEK